MLLHKSKAMHTLVLFFLVIFLSGQITTRAQTWQDAFEALGIAWNGDGSLNRTVTIPMVPPTPSADGIEPAPIALSRDVFIDPRRTSHVRIFIPVDPPTDRKLPLIIYIHGGDFVLFSASTVLFHNFCNDIASQFPAVVVSVEHRLAPEKRLPAAYDDTVNVLRWAQTQAGGIGGRDPWMEYANFSRVFLMGSGAGGNIAFNAALQAQDEDLSPLQIKGLLMNQPYFGGVERTESEIRLENDSWVPLYMNDILWGLALELGLTRDFPYCNPIAGGTYGGKISKLPNVYIKGDEGDPLVDRSKILHQHLFDNGVLVFYRFNPGGHHSIELVNATAAQELYDDMKFFVNELHGNLKTGKLPYDHHRTRFPTAAI